MSNKEAKPVVVLLHGLGLNKWSMVRLSRALRRDGYRVLALTYPSLRRDLAGIVAFVHDRLVAAGLEGRALNFVTHSMGGLVARAYITRYRPAIGRIVMIAPPNAGNEIIDRIADGVWWARLTRRLIRNAIPTLTTRRTPDMDAQLGGAADYPLGIIAGTTSYYAAGHFMVPRPNDGVASVARARLDGMTALLEVPGSHSLMLFQKHVRDAVRQFLRDGTF